MAVGISVSVSDEVYDKLREDRDHTNARISTIVDRICAKHYGVESTKRDLTEASSIRRQG
jgi:predicted transcriptional regulator